MSASIPLRVKTAAVIAVLVGMVLGAEAEQKGMLFFVSAQSGALTTGDIVIRVSGSCGAGFTESAALSGQFPLGTLAANGDQGTTGGSDTLTPAGTISAPTVTMNSYTPAGTVSPPTFTGTPGTIPAETISYPAAAPTFTGTPGTVPAETFSGNSNTTSAVSAGTPAGTNSTVTVATTSSTFKGTSSGGFSAIGGAAPGSSFTVPAETFTGSALGTHTHTVTPTGTNSTVSFTPAGTIAWPLSVPTNSTASFTPAGTNSAPAFTGNSATLTGSVSAPLFTGSSFDNRPAFTKVIYCVKQ